ncbi:anthranilate phosphoribosyltransferase [Methanobacterium sp. SMA-27]|uniref:anthranilate phosphoribosyltransferase n=1 Tax=Methanobacterium sp. SMA-27 TaxID=1495336 RepID=UPI00064FE383|nr:anthranilate phosphoribosyltransferase [Methanobacterium sp. SMA-27]
MIEKCITKVVSNTNLGECEAYNCMLEMVSGEAEEIQSAAFLTAISIKGESVEEITGFVKAMRSVCIEISPSLDCPLVDTCGTGGDIFKTFNVSTISAIIAASAGVAIAKHGNRSITSKCGGADILEALGVNINCNVAEVELCLENAGMGFMFAPNFHPAMKKMMPIRKKLGIRTVFNILGPLTSPANADIQLLGVFDPEYVDIIAQVLKNLGVKRAMVVHGYDENDEPAMDEISTIGKTRVAFLEKGHIKVEEIYPEDFGLKRCNPKFIKAPETIEENLEVVKSVLNGKNSSNEDNARLEICLVNTAAILFLAGKAKNLEEGVKIAMNSIESGMALEKLLKLIDVSNS